MRYYHPHRYYIVTQSPEVEEQQQDGAGSILTFTLARRLLIEAVFTVYWVFVFYALAKYDAATCDPACTRALWLLSLVRAVLFWAPKIVFWLARTFFRAAATKEGGGGGDDGDGKGSALVVAWEFVVFAETIAFTGLGISFATSATMKSGCVSALTDTTSSLGAPLLLVMAWMSCGMDGEAAVEYSLKIARDISRIVASDAQAVAARSSVEDL